MSANLAARARRRRRLAATRWLRDRSGIVFVEFALILPFVLLLFMGLMDFGRAFNEHKRIAMVSSTIADLIAQQSTTSSLSMTTVDSVLNAASAIMTPYSTNNLTLTVSAIQLTPNQDGTCCQAKTQWTVTRGGQLRPCNVVLTQVASTAQPSPTNILAAMIDSSMLSNAASTQLIVADVNGQYQPLFAQLTPFLSGGFQKTSYRSPRGWGLFDLASTSTSTPNEQARICFSS